MYVLSSAVFLKFVWITFYKVHSRESPKQKESTLALISKCAIMSFFYTVAEKHREMRHSSNSSRVSIQSWHWWHCITNQMLCVTKKVDIASGWNVGWTKLVEIESFWNFSIYKLRFHGNCHEMDPSRRMKSEM